MSDWPDLLARTFDVVRTPVALLDDRLLDRPTPCSDWTVGELFEHLVGAISMFATAAGAPPAEATATASPLERFDAAARRNLAAWAAFTDHGSTLTLPFGEFPAELVVAMNQFDSLLHGWDLSAALGLPTSLPSELVDRAMQTAQLRVPASRGHAFGPEVTTHDTSATSRLVAFTGRDPAAWTGAIWVAGSLVTVKPTVGDGAVASAVEIWEREGSGPPKHVHQEHDEIWYVLDGAFRFALGDREFDVQAGELVVGPRGVPHTFAAITPDARMLDIHSPGGFERFFVQAGRPAAALVPPQPLDDASAPRLRATIEEFGAHVVGPPLATTLSERDLG
jgi:uncharacterized protein (TIGR03086 family)